LKCAIKIPAHLPHKTPATGRHYSTSTADGLVIKKKAQDYQLCDISAVADVTWVTALCSPNNATKLLLNVSMSPVQKMHQLKCHSRTFSCL
jgi:hypothetical protein